MILVEVSPIKRAFNVKARLSSGRPKSTRPEGVWRTVQATLRQSWTNPLAICMQATHWMLRLRPVDAKLRINVVRCVRSAGGTPQTKSLLRESSDPHGVLFIQRTGRSCMHARIGRLFRRWWCKKFLCGAAGGWFGSQAFCHSTIRVFL